MRLPPSGVRDDSLRRVLSDGMEEAAGNVAAPPPGWPEGSSLTVMELHERRVVSRYDQRRIVKFMATYDCAGLPERTIAEQPRFAVPEVEPPLGEASRMS